jgi:hypothetical protein
VQKPKNILKKLTCSQKRVLVDLSSEQVGFLILESSSIMAKKTNSFSHPEATEKLDQLAQSGTFATELIYDILRIFANFGDGQVRRTKEGPGNAIHDGKNCFGEEAECGENKNLREIQPIQIWWSFQSKGGLSFG